jgi:hypothetical protein
VGLVGPTPCVENGCHEGDVNRAVGSNAYRFRVTATDWRRVLGQLDFDLVLAWREVEAELIVPRWHILARNPWAAGIESWTAGNEVSLDYPHNCAGVTAAKYDSASYRPRTGSTLG